MYGESMFVVMLGGLHIEMSFLRLIGDWLAGSGWAEAITTANVTTEGRVDGLLKGSHVTRGQWAHQVSAAALYVLQKRAYAAYKEELTSEDTLDFDDWCNHMQVSHPQFNYSKVMKLQLLFLQFLRSQREANFQLYRSIGQDNSLDVCHGPYPLCEVAHYSCDRSAAASKSMSRNI